jgi:RNA polymerase-binding transcription factor DksA
VTKRKSDALARLLEHVDCMSEYLSGSDAPACRAKARRRIRELLDERSKMAAGDFSVCSCCGGQMHEPMRAAVRAAVLRRPR